MKVEYKNDGSSGPGYSSLTINDLYYDGEKIEVEVRDNDNRAMDVILNRRQVEDLRDRLNKFLGSNEKAELITVIEE